MSNNLQKNSSQNPQEEGQFPRKLLAEAVEKELRQKPPSTCPLELFIFQSFSDLTDPRLDRKKRHLLQDIVVISICAILSGADDWVGVVEFGKAKYDWLKTFLKLPNGIPSHDTFGRVFSLIDPDEFQAGFAHWISLATLEIKGEIVAVDGKTLRGSDDQRHGRSAIQMVSAWASSNRVVLG